MKKQTFELRLLAMIFLVSLAFYACVQENELLQEKDNLETVSITTAQELVNK